MSTTCALLPCRRGLTDQHATTSVKSTGKRPNIVLIMADDMGFGDVHALNAESTIPTPNLDRLAREGMTFTDAHTPSAVCTPTRYGLLTGRYCWRSKLKRGVLGGYSPPLIDPARRTIATMLRSKGYHTATIGKWHLGMQMPMLDGKKGDTSNWAGDPGIDWTGKIQHGPTARGFDECFNVSASLDMAPYVFIRNERFTKQPTHQQPALKFPDFVRAGPRADDFNIDEVLDRLTSEVVSHLKTRAAAKTPFFLYFPLTAPHKPATPHERFRGKTKLGPYGDFVAQVDGSIGTVLDTLDELKLTENTIVFYTSDNGSYMYRFDAADKADHVDDPSIQGFRAAHHRANGPWRGTKADIWEAGHHVPFFVRWPKHVKPNSRSVQPVCLTDVFATCAEIVGAKLDNASAEDSFSLLPTLNGDSARRGAPVIHHSVAGMFAIRDGDWKLVLGNGSGGRQAPKGKPFGKPYQLYDLAKEPGEATDLASKHADVVESLVARFQKIHDSGRSVQRD
ncbi:MAG: arylsulfatase [Planctomycetota bacterium]|nr:arylsulfatase [Planctomycetota bacterium]